MHNYVQLGFTCGFYLGISVGLGVYNKYLLEIHDFPSLLLSVQFFFLFIFSFILILTVLKPKLRESTFWITKITARTYLVRLCPIGILYGLDIIFTTLGMTYGPYAFVEMIKSGLCTIVLIFTCLYGNIEEATIDFYRILSVIIITIGQILIYFTEVDFSWISFVFSVLALFTSSLKIIFIEKLVANHRFEHRNRNNDNNNNMIEMNVTSVDVTKSNQIGDNNEKNDKNENKTETETENENENKMNDNESESIASSNDSEYDDGTFTMSATAVNNDERIHSVLALFYFMPIAFILSFVLFLFTEKERVMKSNVLTNNESLFKYLFLYLISALLALALNWSELFFIRHWTALTFSVLSGVKLMFVIAASWIILNHQITIKGFIAYIMVVCGVMLYNYSKIKSRKSKQSNNESNKLSSFGCCNYNCNCFKHGQSKQYGKIWSDFPDPYNENENTHSATDREIHGRDILTT